MKVRTGFVSNSSSSSFVVYGSRFDTSDLDEIVAKKMNKTPEEMEEISENGEMSELLESWATAAGLEVQHDYDSGTVYIGISPFDIKDDETGLEFKNRVETVIKDLLGKEVECEQISETIYN